MYEIDHLCWVCGELLPQGRRRTCSHECYEQYTSAKIAGQIELLDHFRLRRERTDIKTNITKAKELRYCCPSCGEMVQSHAHRKKGQPCYQCVIDEREEQRQYNQQVINSRKLHKPRVTVMKLYNCKSAGHPGAFIITKFDNNMEVESSYLVSNGECACPRGHAHTCRHRDMLHKFRQYKHIDDPWFLDWDTRLWHQIAISQTVADELEARNGKAHDTSPNREAPVEKEPETVTTPVSSAPPTSHPVGVTTGATKSYRRLPR